MELIWHGTACIELRCDGGRILFDPFMPLKGSETVIDADEFDGFDCIFVTHGHFDHIVSIPEICGRNPETNVYCTKTPYETLLKKGVEEKRLNLLQYGDEKKINGFNIRVIHGKHAELPKATPKRMKYIFSSGNRDNVPFIARENRICRENDETVFYQINAEGKTISLMGSLNLRDEIEYPVDSDLLVLPYNGWEDNFPPACSAIERLKPKKVILDHFDDTFPPITMKIDLRPILDKYPGLVTREPVDKAVQI